MQAIDDFSAEDSLLLRDRVEENPIVEQQTQQDETDSTRKYRVTMNLYLIIGFLSTLAYLTYVSLKLSDSLPQGALWSYSSILLLVALAMFTEVSRLAVYNPRRQMKTLARAMTLMLVYSTVVLTIIFNVLICLKADDFIKARFILLFLPPFNPSAFVYRFIMFLIPL